MKKKPVFVNTLPLHSIKIGKYIELSLFLHPFEYINANCSTVESL